MAQEMQALVPTFGISCQPLQTIVLLFTDQPHYNDHKPR
jgi:hypothetical protein